VIVKLVAPHATLTGQTGAVLAIFAVAALQGYVLAASIDRIARKLLQASGFAAMAAAFACL
jgi:MFS transporter, PHS family, inorganic phosphate transporter